MNDRFEHKKSLGQHFLNSDVVPGWLCDAAELKNDELVVEIGPGTGALTRELLARGSRVLALETDLRAIEVLRKNFAEEIKEGALTIKHADVRELDLATLGLTPHGYQVVANIPYYLSGYLFRTLLTDPIQPRQLVFLVQKEVAKRGTSSLIRGEKESLLSLSLKLYGTPEYVKAVSKGHFTPPPKVDSAIIAVRNLHLHNGSEVPNDFIFSLLHLGFQQKRKQLLGNLRAKYPAEQLTHSFSTAGLPLTVRAEDVPLETWLTLAENLYEAE